MLSVRRVFLHVAIVLCLAVLAATAARIFGDHENVDGQRATMFAAGALIVILGALWRLGRSRNRSGRNLPLSN
jgi:hypothetical protein